MNSIETTSRTYRITFVNESKGGVSAHAAGCADLKKSMGNDEIAYDYDASSLEDATADFNADFDKEVDGWYEIDFKPCTAHVPATDDSTDGETLDDATDVKRGWPNCRCNCGARTQTREAMYLPGHDARHAGNVAREIARVHDGIEAEVWTTNLYEMLVPLPSDSLRAKARTHAVRLIAKKITKAAKVVANSEKVAVAEVQKVGSVKVGRWAYPVRNAAGLAQRNTKRDGSGEWVAVEPGQIVTYN